MDDLWMFIPLKRIKWYSYHVDGNREILHHHATDAWNPNKIMGCLPPTYQLLHDFAGPSTVDIDP